MMKKSFFIVVSVFFISSTLIIAQTWLPIKRLSWSSKGGVSPVIEVDSGNHLHVVWEVNYTPNPISPTDHEIFYKKSTDSGTTWSGAKRLTWNPGWANNLTLAIDSNDHIHLAWNDNQTGTAQLYYKKSTDGGTSWLAPSKLTWSTTGSLLFPTIGIDSNHKINLVWFDNFKRDLFYKRSTNGGQNWEGAQRLTWSGAVLSGGNIAIDSLNHIHIVFADGRSGRLDIYYKKGSYTIKSLR